MSLIDLHIHTTVSDGSLSATEVIALAKERGVSHLAWTDHDTTALAAAHAEEARHAGLAAIPGVELSAYDKTLGARCTSWATVTPTPLPLRPWGRKPSKNAMPIASTTSPA